MELIHIAARLLAEEGPEAMSTRRIASDAATSTMSDLALLGRAYRHTAVANANLYSVMFGGRSLAGFQLTEEDRQYGRYTMVRVGGHPVRPLAAGGEHGDPGGELGHHGSQRTLRGLLSGGQHSDRLVGSQGGLPSAARQRTSPASAVSAAIGTTVAGTVEKGASASRSAAGTRVGTVSVFGPRMHAIRCRPVATRFSRPSDSFT